MSADRDFGSKPGAGVLSSVLSNVDRRERLRKLALETIDLSKDPYFMKNHLGSYECKLCLTLHNNEGNYLAHTQGKRHKTNLSRRLAKEQAMQQQQNPNASLLTAMTQPKLVKIKKLKIGRPGYHVIKTRHPETNQRSLIFQIEYPEIEQGLQPRHRLMSAYEQKLEHPPNPQYQYLLFAADPYEIISFKIPNVPLDKSEGKFITEWDKDKKQFTLQLYFDEVAIKSGMAVPPPPSQMSVPAPPKI